MGINRGFVFSIEALLGATVLFLVFLLISDIDQISTETTQSDKILDSFADATLSALEKTNAIEIFMKNSDDLKIKNISESMPASICTQIEIYNNSQTPTNLIYTYTAQNCELSWDTIVKTRYSTYLNRTNKTNVDIFWIKAIHYARK
jgi:Flp pilus assembly protein TadG